MKISELPDIDKTMMLQEGGHIAFVEFGQDPDPENPLDMDMGDIISLSRRHGNFDLERFEENQADPDCVILSYFEHGNCMWFVCGGSAPAGVEFQWDGTRVAGMWIPGGSMLQELQLAGEPGSPARRKKALSLAADACRLYTDWCNGDVYEWHVTAYAVRHFDGEVLLDKASDYRFADELVSEGCSGIYINDSAADRQYVLDAINDALADLDSGEKEEPNE